MKKLEITNEYINTLTSIGVAVLAMRHCKTHVPVEVLLLISRLVD